MAHDSRFDRYELFAATAVLAAHASNPQSGFRHRDVRFLIELFSNWVESALRGSALAVQNTQVARYVSMLAAEGFARRVSRKGYPVFRLTRLGLIELVSRIVGRNYLDHREHFFFLCYFVKNYRPRLEDLIRREGRQFPLSLRLELDILMDVSALVARETDAAKQELAKLDERIHDALSTSAYVEDALRKGKAMEEVVREVEKLYPYELNSQKPLSQLIFEIPPDMRGWELQRGNKLRVHEVFRPTRALLAGYISQLEALRSRLEDGEPS
jgi:hypothetical protein